mmetsp:Transcript_6856/g.19448  ORF Transcript_6856/g.19448 Transcript_6856/m.19448 type:complete len:163 (+) Transcript_6856:75-563(+)
MKLSFVSFLAFVASAATATMVASRNSGADNLDESSGLEISEWDSKLIDYLMLQVEALNQENEALQQMLLENNQVATRGRKLQSKSEKATDTDKEDKSKSKSKKGKCDEEIEEPPTLPSCNPTDFSGIPSGIGRLTDLIECALTVTYSCTPGSTVCRPTIVTV